MAMLAVAAVALGGSLAAGAITGSALIGAAVGLGISTVGGMLFAPKMPDLHTEGPRLKDLGATNSQYGIGIPRVWGQHIVPGNIIWMGAVIEHKREHSEGGGKGKGGGKGGGSVSWTEYTYSTSFAIALCAGEMQRVITIFMDNKKVFDATGGGIEQALSGGGWVFYPGSETQSPDPTMAAELGEVPAHRGLCYIVFRDFDLTPWGNRLPNMQFVVQSTGEESNVVESLGIRADYVTLGDASYGRAYTTYESDALALETSSGEVVSQIPLASAGITGAIKAVSPRGKLLFASTLTANWLIHLVDPITLIPLRPAVQVSWGFAGGSNFGDSTALSEYLNPLGEHRYVMLNATTQNIMASGYNIPVACVVFGDTVDAVKDLLGSEVDFIPFIEEFGPFGNSVASYFARGKLLGTSSEFWWIHASRGGEEEETTTYQKSEVTVEIVTVKDVLKVDLSGNYWFTPEFSHEIIGRLSPDDFDPEGRMENFIGADLVLGPGVSGGCRIDGVIYDSSSDSAIITACRQTFALRISRSGQIMWRFQTRPDYVPTFAGANADDAQLWHDGNDTTSGTIALRGIKDEQHGFWEIAISTGAPDKFYAVAGVANGPVRSQFFDSSAKLVVSEGRIYYLGRAPVIDMPITQVLEALSAEVGQTENNFADIADLSAYGYLQSRPMTARSIIEPLASIFDFDAVESGGQLRWIKRGKPVVQTIGRGELVVAAADDDAIQETRTQEIELPQAVSVTYAERDRNYELSTVYRQRYAGNESYETMRSRNRMSVEAPVVIPADLAKQAADRMLMAAWNGRTSHSWKLPPWGVLLDPGDAVVLNLPGGFPAEEYLVKHTVGADYSVEIDSIARSGKQYTSVVQAGSGDGYYMPGVSKEMLTRLYLLPVPYVLDSHDQYRLNLTAYYAVGAMREGWRNGGLDRKMTDPAGFLPVAPVPVSSPHGQLLAPFAGADPQALFCFRPDDALRVKMIMGDLVTVSYEELLAGANAAVIMHSATEAEIVQFQEAALEDDGTYTLRGFLRGRRGTDYCAVREAPMGTAFVMLGVTSTDFVPIPLAHLQQLETFRAYGGNQLPSRGDTQSIVMRGWDLRPYAPWNVRATQEGSDIRITWVRRTRLRGELRASVGDVPLEEDTERYEVDISVGGRVIQTVTSDTPEYLYTAANQLADDFIPGGEFTVYQMSAQVGRGFPSLAAGTIPAMHVAQLSPVIVRRVPEFFLVARFPPVAIAGSRESGATRIAQFCALAIRQI